jgi:hypothetical protein
MNYIDAVIVKRTKPVSLEELWDYEAEHPVVFASPRALAEARLIAELDRLKTGRRRGRRNRIARSASGRKLAAA